MKTGTRTKIDGETVIITKGIAEKFADLKRTELRKIIVQTNSTLHYYCSGEVWLHAIYADDGDRVEPSGEGMSYDSTPTRSQIEDTVRETMKTTDRAFSVICECDVRTVEPDDIIRKECSDSTGEWVILTVAEVPAREAPEAVGDEIERLEKELLANTDRLDKAVFDFVSNKHEAHRNSTLEAVEFYTLRIKRLARLYADRRKTIAVGGAA